MKIEINVDTKAEEVYEAIQYMSVRQYLELLKLIMRK